MTRKKGAKKKLANSFMSGEELRKLTFGLSVAQIGELCGYSESTVRRWQDETWNIPFVVQQFLRLRVD